MGLALPLSGVADAWLARLARETGSAALRGIDGATLLGERAMLGGFRVPGRVSAGGGCRLYDAIGGAVALNLSRPADRELLPALFQIEEVADVAAAIGACDARQLVARGRELGLAIATEHEAEPAGPACRQLAKAPPAIPPTRRPRVIDLSTLWAGPLAGHLLHLAGADVTKIESPHRADGMRQGDAAFFALLHRDKADLAFDLRDGEDRAALLSLIAGSDIVIEAARPRALMQLGIDADSIVRAQPGLSWVTITGHGVQGDAANWVGFGDDCGVAAGLSAAMRAATGRPGFAGDAIADPLTGIRAAGAAWSAWASGRGGRFALSMRGTVAEAMAQDEGLDRALIAWGQAAGEPFPTVRHRQPELVAC
jgi:hypothetical protein